MDCPSCRSPLEAARDHGFVLERCRACRGTWFGPGVLQAYVSRLIQEGAVPDAAVEVGRHVVPTARLAGQAPLCPRCGAATAPLNYGYDSNVVVGHCHPCGGHWVGADDVLRIAVHTKGHPRLNALGAALVSESGELQRETEKVGFLVTKFNPLAFALYIPYATDAPPARRLWVLPALAVVNVVVFLLEPSPKEEWLSFLRDYALIPSVLPSRRGFHTLLTYAFLHANWLHLLGNMYFLWLFGRNVEGGLGWVRFLAFYVFCALFSGLAHALLTARQEMPIIGASGAVSGVLGGYLRLYPASKVSFWVGRGRSVRFSARFYIGVWLALQALGLLKDFSLAITSGVGFLAHLGGFMAGYALTPASSQAPSAAGGSAATE